MQIPLKFREFIAWERRETKRSQDQLLRGSFDIRTVKKYYLRALACVEAPVGCIKIYPKTEIVARRRKQTNTFKEARKKQNLGVFQ